MQTAALYITFVAEIKNVGKVKKNVYKVHRSSICLLCTVYFQKFSVRLIFVP